MFYLRPVIMGHPPTDRPLALASSVRTMRDHYLAIRCRCGSVRVIAIGRMADDRRTANFTSARVAVTLRCDGCYNYSGEVHLTATTHGLRAPVSSVNLVWTMPLVVRDEGGTKQRRQMQS